MDSGLLYSSSSLIMKYNYHAQKIINQIKKDNLIYLLNNNIFSRLIDSEETYIYLENSNFPIISTKSSHFLISDDCFKGSIKDFKFITNIDEFISIESEIKLQQFLENHFDNYQITEYFTWNNYMQAIMTLELTSDQILKLNNIKYAINYLFERFDLLLANNYDKNHRITEELKMLFLCKKIKNEFNIQDRIEERIYKITIKKQKEFLSLLL